MNFNSSDIFPTSLFEFWAIATLLGGVLVTTAYWAMHHSSLRAPDR